MKVETLAQQLLFSTVRLETVGPTGAGTATTFVFNYLKDDAAVPVLVTNKHVVERAETARFFFTASDGKEPVIGKAVGFTIEDAASQWHGHPRDEVDVAVMPLGPLITKIRELKKQIFFRFVPSDWIPTEEQIEELDALEEVVFVGYPNGLLDTKNLTPIMRRGTTATPLALDYNGEPVFLIDASVFPGSSGSPVFIHNVGSYSTMKGLVVGSRIIFLGLVGQVAYREDEGEIGFRSIPTAQVPFVKTREMIDLGVVYKASTVVETVEDLIKARGLKQA
ncbi:MAG: trypsin-like peptidase domain-containing protein [Chloroflexi bacterium]|nr:trypsin-like peptidase domain-containing protein [Chloroflexota bacterium]